MGEVARYGFPERVRCHFECSSLFPSLNALVISLKTAEALGVSVASALLATADEVID